MPGFVTHYLFGVSTIQKKNLSRSYPLICSHPAAFGLGLQGPDVFFYDLFSYVRYKVSPGSAAHSAKSGCFFYYLLHSRTLFSDPSDYETACAYILGFIGHYTLDTFCHPYIYDKSHYDKNDPSYYGRHVYLETDIDSLLLAQKKHLRPSEFHADRTIRLSGRERHVIASMLCYVYSHVFPQYRLNHLHTRLVTCMMELGVWVLRDPSGKKKALLRMAERRIPGYAFASPLIASDRLHFTTDPLNLSHRRWSNPWDRSRTSTASFPELMQEAAARYRKRIKLCEDVFFQSPSQTHSPAEEHLLSELGSRSYSSGLHV